MIKIKEKFDGAVHWVSMGPRLRNAFLKYGSSEFSDLDWLQYISWGSHKIRFQWCMNPNIKRIPSCTFVPFKDTGGKLIALELLGHVAIPYNWKEFILGASLVRTFSNACLGPLEYDLLQKKEHMVRLDLDPLAENVGETWETV